MIPSSHDIIAKRHRYGTRLRWCALMLFIVGTMPVVWWVVDGMLAEFQTSYDYRTFPSVVQQARLASIFFIPAFFLALFARVFLLFKFAGTCSFIRKPTLAMP